MSRIFDVPYFGLSSESVVDAECQADHFLRNDHQRSSDVDGVRAVVHVLAVQVDA